MIPNELIYEIMSHLELWIIDREDRPGFFPGITKIYITPTSSRWGERKEISVDSLCGRYPHLAGIVPLVQKPEKNITVRLHVPEDRQRVFQDITGIALYGWGASDFLRTGHFSSLRNLAYNNDQCQGELLEICSHTLQKLKISGDFCEVRLECPLLSELDISYDTRVSVLTLQNAYCLERLVCIDKGIKKLTLDCPYLSVLRCDSNLISSMTLNCPRLEYLSCESNRLMIFKADLPIVQEIVCSDNGMRDIDIYCPLLFRFFCHTNVLKEIHCSTLTKTKIIPDEMPGSKIKAPSGGRIRNSQHWIDEKLWKHWVYYPDSSQLVSAESYLGAIPRISRFWEERQKVYDEMKPIFLTAFLEGRAPREPSIRAPNW